MSPPPAPGSQPHLADRPFRGLLIARSAPASCRCTLGPASQSESLPSWSRLALAGRPLSSAAQSPPISRTSTSSHLTRPAAANTCQHDAGWRAQACNPCDFSGFLRPFQDAGVGRCPSRCKGCPFPRAPPRTQWHFFRDVDTSGSRRSGTHPEKGCTGMISCEVLHFMAFSVLLTYLLWCVAPR